MPRFDRLEIGPDSNEPHENGRAVPPIDQEFKPAKLADRHRRSGNYENALRFYSRALEEDKSFVAGWVGQVEMLILLGEVPEADLWCRKALEIFGGNGELLAVRTRALCRLGDLRQAGAVSDAALAAQGRSAVRWMARGEWMLASRQQLDRHCFDKAQQVDADWLVPLETALIYRYYRFPSQGLGPSAVGDRNRAGPGLSLVRSRRPRSVVRDVAAGRDQLRSLLATLPWTC